MKSDIGWGGGRSGDTLPPLLHSSPDPNRVNDFWNTHIHMTGLFPLKKKKQSLLCLDSLVASPCWVGWVELLYSDGPFWPQSLHPTLGPSSLGTSESTGRCAQWLPWGQRARGDSGPAPQEPGVWNSGQRFRYEEGLEQPEQRPTRLPQVSAPVGSGNLVPEMLTNPAEQGPCGSSLVHLRWGAAFWSVATIETGFAQRSQ